MEIGLQLTMLSQETKKIQPSNTLILKIGTRNFSFLLVKSSDKKILDFYEHNYENHLDESDISKISSSIIQSVETSTSGTVRS